MADSNRKQRPPLQGDYLDPFIEECAGRMADGKYAKIPEGVREDDTKKFWARCFALRDQILRERGEEPPPRKIGGASSEQKSGAGTEILKRLDGIDAKLDRIMRSLGIDVAPQADPQEDIPF